MLKQRLSRINPWLAVVGTFSIVLIVYYLLLGYQYWTATASVDGAAVRIDDLRFQMQRATTSRLTAERMEDESQRSLQESLAVFETLHSEDMIIVISESAAESGITLLSIIESGASAFTQGGASYEVHPVSLSLQGSVQDATDFIEILATRVPSLEVKLIRFAGVVASSQIQMELAIYALSALEENKSAKSS
ncbi:MAG: hypothetical protein O2854_01225 [Chloroflexi bacterium]|nr:hypothetical protein [Chloroflexota bacterium]